MSRAARRPMRCPTIVEKGRNSRMTESEITGSGDDRRGFMKGAAVTAAAVGAGVLAPGSAYPVGNHSRRGVRSSAE